MPIDNALIHRVYRAYQTDIAIRQRMNSAFQSDTSIKTVTSQPCQAGLAINRDISIRLRMNKTYMYSTKTDCSQRMDVQSLEYRYC